MIKGVGCAFRNFEDLLGYTDFFNKFRDSEQKLNDGSPDRREDAEKWD